ncbi:hypothetical protein GSI_10375 [Ganoderma sinense ZZ0214-1]|uniref:Uncharacterized protein n=1 Tax=Ganoderma sinense ZZ0214-1 TaxID=1077348 RepID=A0A2G8S0E4_9APHY|nr:hypothetical protein GSI_10375 [Ganoderma sinense ZZ0214-1]
MAFRETRYQGQAPSESSRTEKAKQVASTSRSTAVGHKRSYGDQRDSDSSDSDSDSPPPLPKKKKKKKKSESEGIKKLKRGHRRKPVADEVINLDDVGDNVSGGAEDGVIEVEDEDKEEVEDEAAAGKRGKGKEHAWRAASDDRNGSGAEVMSYLRYTTPNMSVLILNASARGLQGSSSDSEFDLPDETQTKLESTADLLTIFSLQYTKTFRSKKKQTQSTEKGRWCSICK